MDVIYVFTGSLAWPAMVRKRGTNGGGWTVRGTSRTAAPGIAAANLETCEGLAAAFNGAVQLATWLRRSPDEREDLRTAPA